MPRLTRVHQKVFASNASNNGVFGSLQAGNPQTSNDVAVLQSLNAFENGWDDAIEQGDKLPPLEEFQGIQYGISYQQAYMLQEGIAEWNASTPYYKGSLAKTISGSSFKLYCSLTDNNTNHNVTNTTYWKKVMDSDDLYAYDSAVVHKTGTETIGGNKTFTSHLVLNAGLKYNASTQGYITDVAQNTAINIGTAPSTDTGYQLRLEDATGGISHRVGGFQTIYRTNGATETLIKAYKPDGSGGTNAYISVTYPATGNPYATCPTPSMTTSTSSTNMVNAGWVNSIGNNVLHLTGEESISGIKTLDTGSEIVIKTKSYNIDDTVTPSSIQYSNFIDNCDKNGTRLTRIYTSKETSGENSIALQAWKGSVNAQIKILSNGITVAPTPSSATDNSTKIATTAWIKNASQNGNLCMPNYGARVSFSTASYTPTSNGIIVVKAHANSPSAKIAVHSDGFIISRAKMTGDGTDVVVWAVVHNGETYDTSGSGTVTRWFIPFR